MSECAPMYGIYMSPEYPDGTKATVQPRVAVNDQGEGKLVGSHT